MNERRGTIKNEIAGIFSAPLFLITNTFKRSESIMTRPTITKTCSVEGCDKKHLAKGLCMVHRGRMIRTGTLGSLYNRGVGQSPQERFWSRVAITADPERCWNWQAHLAKNGYSTVCVDGRHWYGHRYAWFLTTGQESSMKILHRCDNRRCVNPQHLREGTHRDNMDDAVSRGRMRGERNGAAKINVKIARQAKLLAADGVPAAEIARILGISLGIAKDIKSGHTWKHVEV